MIKKILVKTIKKEVKKNGNSGHIIMGKDYIGDLAEIKIYKKVLYCKGCHETLIDKENFSKDDDLCLKCYNEKQAVESGKCIVCGGENPIEGYWGQCESCFFSKDDELKDLEGVKD